MGGDRGQLEVRLSGRSQMLIGDLLVLQDTNVCSTVINMISISRFFKQH